jgi:hypothetical protein
VIKVKKKSMFCPPKTLFWTLFWGCDGCHRFLGVGGVGFGGIHLVFLMETQNQPFNFFVGFVGVFVIFSIFGLAATGLALVLPYVAYAR